MNISKPKYFPALTGLRVILASMVFIYHYSGLGNYNLTITQIAVVLKYRMTAFFVLSGFVVMYSLLPKGQLTPKEYVKFILNRLIRLLPFYYFILFVPYLYDGFPTLQIILTNITLMKGYFSEFIFSGIAVSWSLTPEISFYFLAPFILKYTSKANGFILSYIIILLIGLLFTFSSQFLVNKGHNTYGFFENMSFTISFTFFGRATDFFAGIYLATKIYYHSDQVKSSSYTINKTYTGLLLVLITSYLVYYFENLANSSGPIISLIFLHIFLPVAVAYFLWGLITEKSKINTFLSSKYMVMLGNGAYGFYLMHKNWPQNLISKINLLPDNGFFLLWLLAVFTYNLFEKPCIYFIRKKLLLRN